MDWTSFAKPPADVLAELNKGKRGNIKFFGQSTENPCGCLRSGRGNQTPRYLYHPNVKAPDRKKLTGRTLQILGEVLYHRVKVDLVQGSIVLAG